MIISYGASFLILIVRQLFSTEQSIFSFGTPGHSQCTWKPSSISYASMRMQLIMPPRELSSLERSEEFHGANAEVIQVLKKGSSMSPMNWLYICLAGSLTVIESVDLCMVLSALCCKEYAIQV